MHRFLQTDNRGHEWESDEQPHRHLTTDLLCTRISSESESHAPENRDLRNMCLAPGPHFLGLARRLLYSLRRPHVLVPRRGRPRLDHPQNLAAIDPPLKTSNIDCPGPGYSEA